VCISALAAIILAVIFWLIMDITAAAALAVCSLIGLISLFFLAKDISRIMLESSPRKFYLIRFSLRFAAFAVLLYLLLAVLRLHFIPVLAGLILPIISFMAAAFLDIRKKPQTPSI
jgi:hypothetical protein